MQRPLTGEPLALDLVNTVWMRKGVPCDALATVDDLADWLRERGLPAETVAAAATEPVRARLVHTRAVLQAMVDAEPGAEESLNAVLEHGLVVRTLEDQQARERVVFADPSWELAWRAADDYLRLLGTGPGSIRRCEHPACILWFHDPTGRRRWCSMAGCGNRAKAARHHARTRQSRR
ncbi:MAG TPA: ABATE domain-containing protein [Actinomycetes bacterium]|nr:ABATE domain-containing protein [Actinomycetes bacterium]